jgi:hypothetical protein
MIRFHCAFLGLAFSSGCFAVPVSEPISPYVETPIQSNDMCSGNFKTRAQYSMAAKQQFPDTLAMTVTTPIVWNHFRGEREIFGYEPAFTPGRISFATNGRPLIRDRDLNLQALMDDGHWMSVSLLEVVRQSLQRQRLISAASPWVPKHGAQKPFDSGPQTDERVVFDNSCRAYTIVNASDSSLGQAFLLYSNDGGHSWAAFSIPGTSHPLYTVSIEAPVDGRPLRASPALIVAQRYEPPAPNGIYPNDAHKAWLLFPIVSSNHSLKFSGPFLISDHTLCCGSHSGFEAQAVSYDDHIYVVYPGDHAVNDPIENRLGTPQYIRMFSRSSGHFEGDPEFIGVGLVGPRNQARAPANDLPDSHSQTALAIDRAGFIHLVIGGHGSRMLYRQSLHSDDDKHWTNPEIFTLQPRDEDKNDYVDEYTYPSLILDSTGQPHVLARWSGESYTFRLIYMTRSNATGRWSVQRILLDPGRAYYGVWYHKMTIDPWDRLFIDYSYYPDNLFADEAAELAKRSGLELRVEPSKPVCVPTDLTAVNPNYCHYLGYQDIGGAVLVRRSAKTAFALATTVNFLEF